MQVCIDPFDAPGAECFGQFEFGGFALFVVRKIELQIAGSQHSLLAGNVCARFNDNVSSQPGPFRLADLGQKVQAYIICRELFRLCSAGARTLGVLRAVDSSEPAFGSKMRGQRFRAQPDGAVLGLRDELGLLAGGPRSRYQSFSAKCRIQVQRQFPGQQLGLGVLRLHWAVEKKDAGVAGKIEARSGHPYGLTRCGRSRRSGGSGRLPWHEQQMDILQQFHLAGF